MISVVLCTYNRCESLKKTLRSLMAMSVPVGLPWELVVVDNNSGDGTRAAVDDFARLSGLNLRYVFEESQGLSHARNAGIREARGDVLCFIDDDVTVEAHWLQSLQRTIGETNCAGVGGKIVPVWPCPKPPWYKEELMGGAIVGFDLGEERRQLNCPPVGANMSFTRAAFEKYGAFRTDLGRVGRNLLGLEDSEFGWRLLRGNETLIYDPRAVVYHPVEMERINKRYFRTWHLNHGRSTMRMNGIPNGTVCYFGIPRTLFRSLFRYFWRSAIAFDSQQTFVSKLRMCVVLGQIAESYDVSRRRRAGAS